MNKVLGILIGAATFALALGAVLYFQQAPEVNASFSGYTYQRALTVANASSTQTNFPVMVCFNSTQGNGNACPTATDLEASSSGGSIMTLNASSTPNDLVFSTTTDASSFVPYEVEKYASTTGEYIAWVKMPTVANNQILYMYYGKSGDTDHSNKTGTWDSNFVGVWHLPDGNNLTATDSIGTNNGIITAATASSTQIDGGAAFNGTSANINIGTTTLPTIGAASYSLWFKTTVSAVHKPLSRWDDSGTGYMIMEVGTSAVNFYQKVNDNFSIYKSTGTSVTSGVWHFIEGTFDGGTTVKFYIDNTGPFNGSNAFGNTTTGGVVTRIGAGNNSGVANDFFTGTVDEVHISNSVRSGTWIATEYNNQSNDNTFWTTGSASGGGTASTAHAQVNFLGGRTVILNERMTIP